MAVEFMMVDPSKLEKNPDNPRTLDTKSLEFLSLVENIKTNGVQVPIAVRFSPESDDPEPKLRIIYGERRVRASIELKLKKIPALHYGEVSTSDAIEMTLAENRDREPLTAIELCRGAASLLKCFDEKSAAAKLGVTVHRIRQASHASVNLSKAWSQYIDEHVSCGMTLDHLAVLCRLPKNVQDTFLESGHLYYLGLAHGGGVIALKEFEEYLSGATGLLKGAKFDSTDGSLYAYAGPCTVCEKRSSHEAGLFEEIDGADEKTIQKNDRCLDQHCFKQKTLAWLEQEIVRQREKHQDLILVATEYTGGGDDEVLKKRFGEYSQTYSYQSAKKSDKGSIPAIVIFGKTLGKLLWLKNVSTKKETKKKPETLAEKRAALKRRREAFAVEKLRNILIDAEPCPEGAGFEVPDGSQFKSAAYFAITFGCSGEAGELKTFLDLVKSGEQKLDSCIRILIGGLLRRLGSSYDLDVPLARQAALEFGIDFDVLVEIAEAALPEPKSWTKEKK